MVAYHGTLLWINLKKFGIDLSGFTEDIKKEIVIKPLTDVQMGPAAQLIGKSARELGFKWKKI